MRCTVAGLVAMALLLQGCGGDRTECDRAPDFAGWREATKPETILSARHEDKRRQVAGRLVECDTLRGASRAEVRRLLGRSGLPGAQRPSDERDTWVFYLGPDGLGIDDENLYVTFDDRGRVVKVEVGQS